MRLGAPKNQEVREGKRRRYCGNLFDHAQFGNPDGEVKSDSLAFIFSAHDSWILH